MTVCEAIENKPPCTNIRLPRSLNITSFTLFNKTCSDCNQVNIVGCPAVIFGRYHEQGISRVDRSWAVISVCERTVSVGTIKQDISTARVDTLVGVKKSSFVHNKRSFADRWPYRGSLGNVFEWVASPAIKPTIVRNE